MTDQHLTSAMKTYKFNPGFQSDDEAVQNFVVRREEFERIIGAYLGGSAASAPRVLVIAPRGAGKTTLCRRVLAEVHRSAELSATWHPIFLPLLASSFSNASFICTTGHRNRGSHPSTRKRCSLRTKSDWSTEPWGYSALSQNAPARGCWSLWRIFRSSWMIRLVPVPMIYSSCLGTIDCLVSWQHPFLRQAPTILSRRRPIFFTCSCILSRLKSAMPFGRR